MFYVYNYLSRIDDITFNCFYGVHTYVNADAAELFEPNEILQNFLYNLGYMYNNAFDLIYEDETTVPNYPYFVASRVGDTLIRFLYRDPDEYDL